MAEKIDQKTLKEISTLIDDTFQTVTNLQKNYDKYDDEQKHAWTASRDFITFLESYKDLIKALNEAIANKVEIDDPTIKWINETFLVLLSDQNKNIISPLNNITENLVQKKVTEIISTGYHYFSYYQNYIIEWTKKIETKLKEQKKQEEEKRKAEQVKQAPAPSPQQIEPALNTNPTASPQNSAQDLTQAQQPEAPQKAPESIAKELNEKEKGIIQKIENWFKEIDSELFQTIDKDEHYKKHFNKWFDLLNQIRKKIETSNVDDQTLGRFDKQVDNIIHTINLIFKLYELEKFVEPINLKISSLKLLEEDTDEIEQERDALAQEIHSIHALLETKNSDDINPPDIAEKVVALSEFKNKINQDIISKANPQKLQEDLTKQRINYRAERAKKLLNEIEDFESQIPPTTTIADEDLEKLKNKMDELAIKSEELNKAEIISGDNFARIYLECERDLNKVKQQNALIKITDDLAQKYLTKTAPDENAELSDFIKSSIFSIANHIIKVPKSRQSFKFDEAINEIIDAMISFDEDQNINPTDREERFTSELKRKSIFNDDQSYQPDEKIIRKIEVSPERQPILDMANKIQTLEIFIDAQTSAIENMGNGHKKSVDKSQKLIDEAQKHINYLKLKINLDSLAKHIETTKQSLASVRNRIGEAQFKLRTAIFNDKLSDIKSNHNVYQDARSEEQQFGKQIDDLEKRKDFLSNQEKDEINYPPSLSEKFFQYLKGNKTRSSHSAISFNYFRNALISLMREGVSIGPYVGIRDLKLTDKPNDPAQVQNDLPPQFTDMNYSISDLPPGNTPKELELRNNYIDSLMGTQADVNRAYYSPHATQENRSLTFKHYFLSLFSGKFKNKVIANELNETVLAHLNSSYDKRCEELSVGGLKPDEQAVDPIALTLKAWASTVAGSKTALSPEQLLSTPTKIYLNLEPGSEDNSAFIQTLEQNDFKTLMTEILAYATYLSKHLSKDTKILEGHPEVAEHLADLDRELLTLRSKFLRISDQNTIELLATINTRSNLTKIIQELLLSHRNAIKPKNVLKVTPSEKSSGSFITMQVPDKLIKYKIKAASPKPKLFAEINEKSKIAQSVYMNETPLDEVALASVKNSIFSALALGVKEPFVISRSDFNLMVMAYRVCIESGVSVLLPKNNTQEYDAYSKALSEVDIENFISSTTDCKELTTSLRDFTMQQVKFKNVSSKSSNSDYVISSPSPQMTKRHVEYVIEEHHKTTGSAPVQSPSTQLKS